MPLIRYRDLRFTKDVQTTIDQANAIIQEYRGKGFSMTLRQIYYQFVARGLVKENTIQQYKRLGDTLSKARIAGQVDWFAIADNTRFLRENGYQPDGEYLPFLKDSAKAWNIDMWSNQKYRPEVWIEKDALAGVVDRICNEMQVPYYAARGYSSSSETWKAGMRLREWKAQGYEPVVFHLGDHDPSGMDMTRDNEDRIWMYAGYPVEVHRLALNMDQVKQYDPPSMPAKKSDSRHGKYSKNFGEGSWELDALDPTIIENLVEKAILGIRDQARRDERQKDLDRQRVEIVELVSRLDPPDETDPYVWRSAF